MNHRALLQAEFSRKTFGQGAVTERVLNHIEEEMDEVRNAKTPEDQMEEWIDIIILAFDGAWRHAHYELGIPFPKLDKFIERNLAEKWDRVMKRKWPDHRTLKHSEPVRHVKEEG